MPPSTGRGRTGPVDGVGITGGVALRGPPYDGRARVPAGRQLAYPGGSAEHVLGARASGLIGGLPSDYRPRRAAPILGW